MYSDESEKIQGQTWRTSEIAELQEGLLAVEQTDARGLTGHKVVIFRWRSSKASWNFTESRPLKWPDLKIVKDKIKKTAKEGVSGRSRRRPGRSVSRNIVLRCRPGEVKA